ncbi:hypothetical protein Y032_0235g3193 [Ancylostoma ceylanicum]|uniref:Phosphotyrosine protein phosphatase I domain-containing protein n=1 Tax=Ancylostoma ceylanicum TaxID=53326 RepID=A0A016SF13_9BILA|nr:hypothetical protein Y032_0235g3193 [Ancylostoma ceylanicum]
MTNLAHRPCASYVSVPDMEKRVDFAWTLPLRCFCDYKFVRIQHYRIGLSPAKKKTSHCRREISQQTMYNNLRHPVHCVVNPVLVEQSRRICLSPERLRSVHFSCVHPDFTADQPGGLANHKPRPYRPFHVQRLGMFILFREAMASRRRLQHARRDGSEVVASRGCAMPKFANLRTRNICRSPIAEAVFLDIIKKRGISDQWKVESSAVIDFHTGKSPDRRAMETLKKFGITDYTHRARVTTIADFREFDYIFGMDNSNISDLESLAKETKGKAKIGLLGEYDPEGHKIVPDPYYESGTAMFEQVG